MKKYLGIGKSLEHKILNQSSYSPTPPTIFFFFFFFFFLVCKIKKKIWILSDFKKKKMYLSIYLTRPLCQR